MATEPVLKFMSPEWRAKYQKPKHLPVKSVSILPAALAARSVSIVPAGSTPKFMSPEWREKYQKSSKSKSIARSVSKSLGVSKLETWQIALLAAGGALVLQHMIAPKGTSIASKIFGGMGFRTSGAGDPLERHCAVGMRWDERAQACVLTGQSGHCPPGSSWNERSGSCESNIPPPPPPSGFYTGAVDRGGYRGGAGIPFGPGPWPTMHAAAPDGNMQMPDPARSDPSMTGWGYGWE